MSAELATMRTPSTHDRRRSSKLASAAHGHRYEWQRDRSRAGFHKLPRGTAFILYRGVLAPWENEGTEGVSV